MTESAFKRVKVTPKRKSKAKKNWGQPITATPSLRWYIIGGQKRLVWVWKENGKYKIRVNDPQGVPESGRTAFIRQKQEAFKEHDGKLERKKLPKNIRNAIAKLSEDNIEWGGAIDFEKGFSLPERFIVKSGSDSYIDISELEDFELTFHTHPIDNDVGYLPSPGDIAMVTFGKPHIMVWTNGKTGKKKFTLIESTKTNDNSTREDRKDEIRKLRNKLVDTWGSNDTKAYYDDYQEQLMKMGYKISPIDPVRTKITMNADNNPENDPSKNVIVVRPTRDFNKKHVQEIIEDTSVNSDTNIQEALMKIQIEADNTFDDNQLAPKINRIIGNDHTKDSRKKLSQIKNLVEFKKVTELRKDIKKAHLPNTDHLEINNENYDKYKKKLKKWKKTDAYQKIKREATKRRMKRKSAKKSMRIKGAMTDRGSGNVMNVKLQEHNINKHIVAMTKEDKFYKEHIDANDIEDLEAFIDPTLSLPENLEQIDRMMKYGFQAEEKRIRGKTKAQAQAELKDMMELMKKGRNNLTPAETRRLNRYTKEELDWLSQDKKARQNRFYAPKKQTARKKQVIEVDPNIEDSIKIKNSDWDIDRVSMTKSNNSIQIGLKAKTKKGKQTKLAKPLSPSHRKNVKRMLGWKRIKNDKKLKATLEATLD